MSTSAPDPAHLDIAVRDLEEAVVLRVAGEIDLATAPQFEVSVQLAAAGHPGRAIAIDMSEVGLIDSTGLRMLLNASREVPAPVVVLTPSHEVRRMLELTLLAATIPVVDDLSEIAALH